MSSPPSEQQEGKEDVDFTSLPSPCAFASDDEDDKCRGDISLVEMAGTGWKYLCVCARHQQDIAKYNEDSFQVFLIHSKTYTFMVKPEMSCASLLDIALDTFGMY